MFVLGDSDTDCLVMRGHWHCLSVSTLAQAGLTSSPVTTFTPQSRPGPPGSLHSTIGLSWLSPLPGHRASMVGPGLRVLVRPLWGWCVVSQCPQLPLLRDSQCSCVCTHMCQSLSPQPVSLSPHLNNTFISSRPPSPFLPSTGNWCTLWIKDRAIYYWWYFALIYDSSEKFTEGIIAFKHWWKTLLNLLIYCTHLYFFQLFNFYRNEIFELFVQPAKQDTFFHFETDFYNLCKKQKFKAFIDGRLLLFQEKTRS